MAIQARKERRLADRRQAILRAARELARDQGWDAVTTRRLAARIEYSQPVLYSHFPGGKDEIVTAVALEGFVEIAAATRAAVRVDASRRERVLAGVRAYLDFARDHPAVYDAMFTGRTTLRFATDETLGPLREGFAALRSAVSADIDGTDEAGEADLVTELAWATLHGLAALTRAGRLPAVTAEARIERFVDLLAGPPS